MSELRVGGSVLVPAKVVGLYEDTPTVRVSILGNGGETCLNVAVADVQVAPEELPTAPGSIVEADDSEWVRFGGSYYNEPWARLSPRSGGLLRASDHWIKAQGFKVVQDRGSGG